MFHLLDYALQWLVWLARHPYLSACLLVVMFLGSIFYPVYRWWCKRTIEKRLDMIEAGVVEMKRKLQAMEKNQDEMLKILREIRQTETDGPSNHT